MFFLFLLITAFSAGLMSQAKQDTFDNCNSSRQDKESTRQHSTTQKLLVCNTTFERDLEQFLKHSIHILCHAVLTI